MSVKLENVKKALLGQEPFGPEYDTHEKVLNRVFSIAEDTAEVDDVDEYTGQSKGVKTVVANRRLIAESRHDFDGIGAERFGRELMGGDFYRQAHIALMDPNFFQNIYSRRQRKIAEDVQADTASLYNPINTWGSFVLGLWDHKILKGYAGAPHVMDRLIKTVPTAIHGAYKHTLHEYDGTLPSYDGISENVEAVTVRGAPAWVWSEEVLEAQLQSAITMEAFKSDLDGGLGRRGEQMGEAFHKWDNYRAGQYYLGYKNRYCFNTVNNVTPSCNTFLSGAAGVGGYGATPFNFINLFYSNPLLTVETLNQAYIQMLQLQDPVRNWRMTLGEDFFLVVSPTIAMLAGQIVHQIKNFGSSGSGLAGTPGTLRETENPLMIANLNIEVISMGIEWKDVLTGGMNSSTGGGTQNITANGPPKSWIDYQNNVANGSNANPLTQATSETPYNLMSTNGLPPTAANSGNNSADGFWMLVSKSHPYMHREVWIEGRPNVYPLFGTDLARRFQWRGDFYMADRFITLEPRAAQINLPNASGTR